MDEYLNPTRAIESAHPAIVAKAEELCRGAEGEAEKAVALFRFVRDEIPYSVYMVSMHADDFRASFVLEAAKGYCVQKAVLLCAFARAARIPCRLALAEIRNHRVPEALKKRLGRDTFPGHAWNEFFISGRWTAAAATFDTKLCARVGVPVVDFDGTKDALLPAEALDGEPYIAYVERFGHFADLPLEFITSRTSKVWGPDKRSWRKPEDDTGFP